MNNKGDTISAAEFKATCLELMDDVASTHREVVITKRGKPVAKLVAAGPPPSLFGSLSGSVEIRGDIVAPTGEEWEADAGS
jgi:prevent-host-death family protein